MDTLILKSNNENIRQALRNNNIKVCRCASFENALWLDYNDSVTNLVHGTGYCDETCPAPPEQVLRCFIKEYESPHCQIEKFDIPEDLKATAEKIKKRNYWEYVRYMGVYGRYTLIATNHYGEITKYY